MTNEEREKEIRKQPIPTKEECLAFYKKLTKLADVRFVPYYKMVIEALEQQPSKGHWIKTGDYYTGAYECLDYFECSCCHEESLEEGDYCPNCGAKMEVREVNTDGERDSN